MSSDIIDLQIRVAFQNVLLEELNQILTSQEERIARLEITIGAMRESSRVYGDTIEQLPPHY